MALMFSEYPRPSTWTWISSYIENGRSSVIPVLEKVPGGRVQRIAFQLPPMTYCRGPDRSTLVGSITSAELQDFLDEADEGFFLALDKCDESIEYSKTLSDNGVISIGLIEAFDRYLERTRIFRQILGSKAEVYETGVTAVLRQVFCGSTCLPVTSTLGFRVGDEVDIEKQVYTIQAVARHELHLTTPTRNNYDHDTQVRRVRLEDIPDSSRCIVVIKLYFTRVESQKVSPRVFATDIIILD